jgi:hypothetical protein
MQLAAPLTRQLAATSAWGPSDFYLIDVGASEGLGDCWQAYKPRFRALGFDPLVAEVKRLNALTVDPKIRYVDAFVTYHGYDELFPPQQRPGGADACPNTNFWSRTSSVRAMNLCQMDYTRERHNAGAEVVWSQNHVQLDDFIPRSDYPLVDFIKIDTDGHDYPVLLGADRLLSEGQVLGLSVECPFQGAVHEHANLFASIDRFLRSKGFALFDLELCRYSRGTLPARFVHNIPAQTESGQVHWGEAVYFRDLGDPAYEHTWRSFDREKLIKLITLFELFGLADCAAELLVDRRSQFPNVNIDQALELLTPQPSAPPVPESRPAPPRSRLARLFRRWNRHVLPARETPPQPRVTFAEYQRRFEAMARAVCGGRS